MKWFWQRETKHECKLELPLEPIRELTGIEKMEAEQTEERLAAKSRAKAARIAELQQKIAAIELQIGPQMQELQKLKDELHPFAAQYRLMASAQYQNAGMQAYYGDYWRIFGNVLGGGVGL